MSKVPRKEMPTRKRVRPRLKTRMRRITFEERHLAAGAHVIMRAGTVVFLGDRSVLVPAGTVTLLKKKKVLFIELERTRNGSLRPV